MSQLSSPSNEGLRLLRRVFGIRLKSDDTLEIPLRHTWKAFSRTEFFALWIVAPLCALVDHKALSEAVHYRSYLAAAFALYLGLATTLIVGRKLTTRVHSGVGVLTQREEIYNLPITGEVLGSAKRKRQPYLLLDGVQFPLVARWFTGRNKRLAAIQVLREWTSCASKPRLTTPNSVTAFLALLDVTSVEDDTVRCRAIWSNLDTYVFLVSAVFSAMLFLILLLTVQPSGAALALDASFTFALLTSIGLAIYLQKSKPEVAVTLGKGVEVVEHGERFTCPPWQSEFVIGRPNPYDDSGPVYPYILLKYGQRYLTIHSSRMYAEDELEDFVDRMNHFLWGGTGQPADPIATKVET
jgi:hypothetical protein